MNSRIWTLIGALMIILALSACGGGGGSGTAITSDPAGGDNQEGAPDPVDGDFYFSSETNKEYQNPDADIFQEKCSLSDYYFESANFIVFSNLTTHSNDDLRTAATKAQSAMDVILPQFGLNWDTFYAMKRVVSFRDLNQFASEVSQLTYLDGGIEKRVTIDQISDYFGGEIEMPAGSADWQDPSSNPDLQYAFVYNALVNERDPKKVRDVMVEAHEGYDQFFADNPTFDPRQEDWNDQWEPFFKKIQICATSNDRIGRSSTSGIKISPDFAEEEYRHELTHLVINQVSKVTAFWAKEGQTHLFLGEDVPASLTDVAVVRDHIIGTDETDPGLENIDKFKKAYLELVALEGVNAQKVLDWHRLSMNIKAEWFDPDGTGGTITDAEREAWIMEAFGEVMPKSYAAFFNDL
ncbi:hypothetical protein QQF73_03360 [Marinobacter sp. M216]|uniref:Peptidase MA-like domain-containing protein n=1 Tax=Marinobacter albus TaxID=3030833 RepID=A0ABT7H8G7_9GAMM|nr:MULTISPECIES: hypothetical protein [unclassified Marinobacter]MBW7471059.1 hypothetical protein [Marinobacter sp. F4218]MDK9556650.1 hypothetical protein [Marinobacter sp. M216]